MIKAVLLDLDDTLIETHTADFFPKYLAALGSYGSELASPRTLGQLIMKTYLEVLQSPDPSERLYDRFMPKFSASLGRDPGEMARFFDLFYKDCYPDLKSLIRPRPATRRLLDHLFSHDYRVVVATNPGLPQSAITQRMAWGEILSPDYPFELITTLEGMHFGKPHPEYYEEILLRLNLDPGEAIMVGDDWEQDILGAAEAGLCTYWLAGNPGGPPDDRVPITGCGSYDSFIDHVERGWLDTISPPRPTPSTLIHRLRAFPSAVDTLRRTYRAELLECCPADDEWSARDIICHLRDHENEEDRARLDKILNEDNPFLSANYDPWAHAHNYASVSADQAFIDFTALRMKTVEWLLSLPPEAWARRARYAIFGPTTFEEMVRFTTEHDLTHLRQMLAAIDHAIITCGL